MNINISVLESSKDIDSWRTGQLIRKIRRDKITELKRLMNIKFDLENDEPSGPKMDINISVNRYPDGSPHLNIFKCQLMKAGGDWEYPVAYFFC